VSQANPYLHVLCCVQTFPNVILTPHEGFYTAEALTRIATVTMENLSFYEQVRQRFSGQSPGRKSRSYSIPCLLTSIVGLRPYHSCLWSVGRAASRRVTWCFAAWGVRGVWYATMSRTVGHRKSKGPRRPRPPSRRPEGIPYRGYGRQVPLAVSGCFARVCVLDSLT
jgi:hypothetical protein